MFIQIRGVMDRQYIPIKSWSKENRPREKLQKEGIAALSTYELLAVLLRAGRGGESALDLARRILEDCHNDLNVLARMSVRDLRTKYKGVGVAKAAAIVVAMEVGRRRAMAAVDVTQSLCSSIEVFNYISPVLKDLDHEEFWVIYLNRSNRILRSERLSSGGMTGTVIDVRILFRKALEMKSNAIIIVHNHPSGSLCPSEYDKMMTAKIREAGKLLDVVLYDHLIVGGSSYFSFVDENLIHLPEVKIKKDKKIEKD